MKEGMRDKRKTRQINLFNLRCVFVRMFRLKYKNRLWSSSHKPIELKFRSTFCVFTWSCRKLKIGYGIFLRSLLTKRSSKFKIRNKEFKMTDNFCYLQTDFYHIQVIGIFVVGNYWIFAQKDSGGLLLIMNLFISDLGFG